MILGGEQVLHELPGPADIDWARRVVLGLICRWQAIEEREIGSRADFDPDAVDLVCKELRLLGLAEKTGTGCWAPTAAGRRVMRRAAP